MPNVAPDRPTYTNSEEDFQRAAQLVLKHSEDQIALAGILYGLNRAYTVREIENKLKALGASTFSYSWIAKLVKVWGHWIVRGAHTPEQLIPLSITKLYYAASYDVDDLDFVRAHDNLTDAEFVAKLRKDRGSPATGKVVTLPPQVVQQIDRLIQRLSTYGIHATTISVLEFVMEAFDQVMEQSLVDTWLLLHGEVPIHAEVQDARAPGTLN
jgi:hypothetical protein